MDNRPIGMFDSGVGGLTVLKEYLKLMPNENYIYYADTKHLPYGEKTREQIISYAEEIVEFFISKNVKAIVIACGTVSSLAYEHLKEKYSVPIFDIITPTASTISALNVGVIATAGSIKSNMWENRIRGMKRQVNVYSQACPRLVPLAEKNLYNSFISKIYLRKYLKELKSKNLDALIMRMYTLSFVWKANSKYTW